MGGRTWPARPGKVTMALISHLCAGIGSGLLIVVAGVAVQAAWVICGEAREYGWSDVWDFRYPPLVIGLVGGVIVGLLSVSLQTRREIEEKKKEAEKVAAAKAEKEAVKASDEAEVEAAIKKAAAAAADEGRKAAAEAAAKVAAKAATRAAAAAAAAAVAKGTEADESGWSWQQVLLVWGAIGFGVLLGGGAAARAYMALSGQGIPLFAFCQFWLPLLLFSAGGGLTIGLFILVWWLVIRLGFSWALGFVVLGLVLFGVFVWPTPYRYSEVTRIEGRNKVTTAVFRINRLTGHAEKIYAEKQQQ
jgi:hypothetical protein